jgi:Raf kinase inhibitor-like YbhB/YbcL family protein
MKTVLALSRHSVISVVLVLAACSSDANTGTAAAGGSAQAGSAGATAGSGGATAGAGGVTAAGQAGSVAVGGNSAGSGGATGGTGGAAAGAGGSIAGGNGGASTGGSGGNAPFELVSTAFKEGAEIPLKYKCDKVNPQGENMSPPLSWGPGPAGTKSYAVVLMHLPTPEHWVIWDIPAAVTSLPENIEHQPKPAMPAGAKQSYAMLDGFTGSGYLGPCPQAVGQPQTYQFTLYALDTETLPGLTDSSSPGEAANVVKMHLVPGSKGVTLSGTQVRAN